MHHWFMSKRYGLQDKEFNFDLPDLESGQYKATLSDMSINPFAFDPTIPIRQIINDFWHTLTTLG